MMCPPPHFLICWKGCWYPQSTLAIPFAMFCRKMATRTVPLFAVVFQVKELLGIEFRNKRGCLIINSNRINWVAHELFMSRVGYYWVKFEYEFDIYWFGDSQSLWLEYNIIKFSKFKYYIFTLKIVIYTYEILYDVDNIITF